VDRPDYVPTSPAAAPGPLPPRLGRPGHHSSRPRVHVLLALATFATLALAGGFFWEGVEPQTELLSLAFLWSLFAGGLRYAVWVFLILGAHEMGHYWACRFYRIPATLPFFIPGIPPFGSFGAVIRIRGPIPDRRALFDIAAAGPIAGFVVALPALVIGLLQAEPFVPEPGEDSNGTFLLGEPVALVMAARLLSLESDLQVNSLIGAGWVGLLVTSLNLFPVGQLDGGHAAYALSRRLHRRLTGATLVLLLGVVLLQMVMFSQFPPYLIWFGILLWMRDRHPTLLDESTPLGAGRKAVACVLAVIFVLSFTLMPIYVS
jgi:membrane-associated protease RseP (regulator of RpoE activity)